MQSHSDIDQADVAATVQQEIDGDTQEETRGFIPRKDSFALVLYRVDVTGAYS